MLDAKSFQCIHIMLRRIRDGYQSKICGTNESVSLGVRPGMEMKENLGNCWFMVKPGREDSITQDKQRRK